MSFELHITEENTAVQIKNIDKTIIPSKGG